MYVFFVHIFHWNYIYIPFISVYILYIYIYIPLQVCIIPHTSHMFPRFLWTEEIASGSTRPACWPQRSIARPWRRRRFLGQHGGCLGNPSLKWLVYKGKPHLKMDGLWGKIPSRNGWWPGDMYIYIYIYTLNMLAKKQFVRAEMMRITW